MNKIVGTVVLLLCLTGCVRDNDVIYYPVSGVDIERGGSALEVGEEDILVARSFNEEDYVLDTIAQYPNDPTLGKLMFMINPKDQQKDQDVADFSGVGKSKLAMSLDYKDGNYPSESQVLIHTPQDVTVKYAVKLRLKGELLVSGDEWMIDYVYAQLANLFQPYPPANFSEAFMCREDMKLGTFDSLRRTCILDITYDRSNPSFSQLYFNLFINLAGQKRENRVRLRIDKESYFKLYGQSEEMQVSSASPHSSTGIRVKDNRFTWI